MEHEIEYDCMVAVREPSIMNCMGEARGSNGRDRRSDRRRGIPKAYLGLDHQPRVHEYCSFPTEFDRAPIEHLKKPKDGKDDGVLK